MKKLMLIGAILCCTILTGCASKEEAMVKELYSIIQSGDHKEGDKFFETNVSKNFRDICERRSETINSREFKKAFGTIAKSKDSPALNVIKTFKEGDLAASAIEAQCAGTVLYFLVGNETKDGPIQILGITSNKDTALQGGN